MGQNDYTDEDDVHVSVELSGSYEHVVEKLSPNDSTSLVPDAFEEDITRVLSVIVEIDGGTRSRITEALPEEMSIEYDSELLVELLQVLHAYELVELDGNTWNPGPRLDVDTVRG
jgi:hypothetical protein